MENLFLNSKTKRLAVAGMLGAFSVVLSVTPFLGYIPIPFLVGVNATTMHIPIIIAAILMDAKVATFVGFIFGVSSFLRATPAFFSDPLVSILPRLLIGAATYYAYKATKSSVFAAVIGTITNTVGVLTMIYLRGYLPLKIVGVIAGVNGTAEVIISAIIVYSIMKILKSKNNL
ncbi:ECF transporter S component [Alkaliphilus hydrothermalis]|uniref:Membrane protein n=1 Tax=Alkaliphilus hydrothermalis TaxID=1482730 RepID=A0ABS2NST8_9FIRM|nr:ECF transporter S component [Alkaliphilus hydrothermalis]MBM7615991.1 putative membrane protein [Alkaliphilus hydrothermalis]